MTVFPEQRIYKPPPLESAADEQVLHLTVGSTERVVVRHSWYRGRVVDFSYQQQINEGGTWHNVARIDCAGGTIHWHLRDRRGRRLRDHDLICDIPIDDSRWEFMHAWCERAESMMFDSLEENRRRWNCER